MPSTYTLTLLSEQANSGPYYVVTYTTASIYGPVQAGSPAYLPDVGSTADVTIQENTASYLAFKLTNNTSGCEYCNNSVILTITGSAPVVPTSSLCCAPTITNVAVTGSTANIYFTTQSGTCASCVAITAQTSSNGVDWGSNTTSGCTSPFVFSSTTGLPTGSYVDFRLQMTCSGSTSSSYSDIFSWVTGSGGGGGGGTGSLCTTYWTVRNASCGYGTVNDVGINGYFMNTLAGPSTFPLTSTLYGTKSSPNGVNCTASNSITVNVTTNLPGTGNCGAVFIYINSSPAPNYTQFFTSAPSVTINGVSISSGDNIEVMVACLPGSCPP